MSILGQVGQGPEIKNYREYTFDQLVSLIRIQGSALQNQNNMNAFQAQQMESLRQLNRNQSETIRKQEKELANLKLKGDASWIAEGRSPLEVKLADENRMLRDDLRNAREQLGSLRRTLDNFQNTPVNVANSELGLGNIHPGPKVMNEELLQRLREEDRQRAKREQRDRIQQDIHNWIVKSEAAAKERIDRLERLAKMEQRTRKYNVNITTDPWADGQFGIADQERGPDPKAQSYAYDEHGPAQPPQTQNGDPASAQGTTEEFIRAIMPKGC